MIRHFQKTPQKEIQSHLFKNILILTVSIVAAILLAKSGIFNSIINATEGLKILGIFIAGFFFTSALTIGPAGVALVKFSQTESIFLIAIVGAIGSVIGDLIIFRFVRDRISDDFIALFQQVKIKRLVHILHLEIFRFLTPFIGALLVASPLPDEIGLAMMGISKIKTRYFIPISYFYNLCYIKKYNLLEVGLILFENKLRTDF